MSELTFSGFFSFLKCLIEQHNRFSSKSVIALVFWFSLFYLFSLFSLFSCFSLLSLFFMFSLFSLFSLFYVPRSMFSHAFLSCLFAFPVLQGHHSHHVLYILHILYVLHVLLISEFNISYMIFVPFKYKVQGLFPISIP